MEKKCANTKGPVDLWHFGWREESAADALGGLLTLLALLARSQQAPTLLLQPGVPLVHVVNQVHRNRWCQAVILELGDLIRQSQKHVVDTGHVQKGRVGRQGLHRGVQVLDDCRDGGLHDLLFYQSITDNGGE
jgi:hypothetical protein